MVRKFALLLFSIGILLTGCHQATVEITPTAKPTGELTAYVSPTATRAVPTATLIVTIPVTPSPTPTPFLHTVSNDDTLLGLAFRYGVSLEALKTANPQVNPNAMSVGSQLVIPISTQAAEEVPTSTPEPVQASQPSCVSTGDGGAWCIVSLRNDLSSVVENLSVWIGLYNSKGQNITSQVAYGPLDILRPGESMPLMAYFAPPLPMEFTSRSQLISAGPVEDGDTRYLEATTVSSIKMAANGVQAEVSGRVVVSEEVKPSQVWLLAVAYDAQGNMIGVRKWKTGQQAQFDFMVYSLSGSIERVEVLVEARP
jgi:LysM repeat protein